MGCLRRKLGWETLDVSHLAEIKGQGFSEYHRDLTRGLAFLTKQIGK
jgi:hypothetical protein